MDFLQRSLAKTIKISCEVWTNVLVGHVISYYVLIKR